MQSPARLIVPVRGWRVEAYSRWNQDVVAIELSTGRTTSIKLDRAQASLLQRACHPSLKFRVLSWEPRWSPVARVEIRPAKDGRATVYVIDPGNEVAAINRVPLVVGLSIATHAGFPLGIHRSLIGSLVECEEDATRAAELEEFAAFLEGAAPGLLLDLRHETVHV